MQDVIIQDYPDIEPNPSTPTSMLYDILDLARECFEKRKAFVSVQVFGGTHGITVIHTDEFSVLEYPNLGSYMLNPRSFDNTKTASCDYCDAKRLSAIIETLREYLA